MERRKFIRRKRNYQDVKTFRTPKRGEIVKTQESSGGGSNHWREIRIGGSQWQGTGSALEW